MEIVDIVSAKDEVIGVCPKVEAHNKGLLHRTAIGMIRDSQNRFVLVKQSASRQDAGQYVSPIGGHVQSGESEDDALKREAMEEMGIKDFQFKLLGKAIFNREVLSRKENHYFIYYEIYSDGPYTINDESDSFQAFTQDELKGLIKNSPKMFGAAFLFAIKNFYPQLLS